MYSLTLDILKALVQQMVTDTIPQIALLNCIRTTNVVTNFQYLRVFLILDITNLV